jgi:hypothetical protein
MRTGFYKKSFLFSMFRNNARLFLPAMTALLFLCAASNVQAIQVVPSPTLGGELIQVYFLDGCSELTDPNSCTTITQLNPPGGTIPSDGTYFSFGSSSVDDGNLGIAISDDTMSLFNNGTTPFNGDSAWGFEIVTPEYQPFISGVTVTYNPNNLAWTFTDPPYVDFLGIAGNVEPLFGPGNGTDLDFSLTVSPAAVPEPTSLLLLGTGIAGIGLAAWRRKKA